MRLFVAFKFHFLILLFSSHCIANIPAIHHYGMEQGLKDEYVKSLSLDRNGTIWLGTTNGLFNFDGYQFTSWNTNTPEENLVIRDILPDHNNNLWVSIKSKGLYKVKNNDWEFIKHPESQSSLYVYSFYHDSKSNIIWMATNDGVIWFDEPDKQLKVIKETSGKSFYSIQRLDKDHLIVGLKGEVRTINIHDFSSEAHPISSDPNSVVRDIWAGDNVIWIAASTNIYKLTLNNNGYEPLFDSSDISFSSIVGDKDHIYASSFLNGLYQINKNTGAIKNFKKKSVLSHSIIDNSITSLAIKDRSLLIGNFHKGLSVLDLDSLKFNFMNGSEGSVECTNSSIFYSGHLGSDRNLWIGSSDGLVKYNLNDGHCEKIVVEDSLVSTLNNPTKILEHDNFLWVGTWKGLIQFDNSSGTLLNHYAKDIGFKEFVIHPENNDIYFYSDKNEVYRFDRQGNFVRINNKQTGNDKIEYQEIHVSSDKTMYFATNRGLLYLTESDTLEPVNTETNTILNENISSLTTLDSGFVLAVKGMGLYLTDLAGNIISHYSDDQGLPGETYINNIIADSEGSLWITSFNGLYRLKDGEIHRFKSSDGTGNYYYYNHFGFLGSDNKLYIGGQNGFIHFDPDQIQISKNPPGIVINKMSILNKGVVPGLETASGFLLAQPINDYESIELTYKDYIVGFEFTATNYSDPVRNQYAYRLKGFNDDWVHVDANNRKATYTNLKSGHYTFEVKASNKDGVWNDQSKTLSIQVHPAPWLTWWAYTLYALTAIGLITFYFRWKYKENIRVTNLLRQQVKEKTQELQGQKQKVEELLAKKNEMFANVSHEFRTPLTLIIGPINKLLHSRLQSEDLDSLKMINRNANRLLTMIEQLLLLAKITGDEKIQHFPQVINHQILSIFEIFKTYAKDKGVEIKLINNNKSAIHAVPNTIDTVLGNLISNAIKYTPAGGSVTINSYTDDSDVIIEVTDTGCGLDEVQKKEIFSRFSRLDSHSNIDGVGIGLSVVEEMIKINNGSIEVNSEPNQGSQFIVRFKKIDAESVDESLIESHSLVSQLAKTVSLENSNQDVQLVESTDEKSHATVLIIEDNDDMRAHIADTLKGHFHCLLADRGKKGIALAIEHVPDIIICDVMMPEMDGFKVSRILRKDETTSHIPLILLTALHDKESRIKGWREHVDAYLTKPFDGEELLLQLNNVLIIRDILRKKAGMHVQAGKHTSIEAGLSKKDQMFVDKLNDKIAENYNIPNYQRAQLASDMAVSEKQLQRKLKALIDKNPMELLREYRLQKAAQKLKEGIQVSISSDLSGFSSVSHFSQCFKAHYGVSPKAYQKLNTNTV